MLVLSLITLASAKDHASASPSLPSTYVITNDDGLLHSYVSYFLAQGPTLTFQTDVNTFGKGIGGGFFGTPRVNLLHASSAQCIFASNAGGGDIAAISIATQQRVGNFLGSANDSGNTNGIGLVLNQNYLYAGYSASNTIGTFSIGAGCQLSFLGDVPAAGLNGGSIGGIAVHGNILVVAYGDGSIQSFNVANGLPISNDDEQNSTGFANAYFPEGVDITQDGHFAIFGDASVPTTIEVSDISSGKLTTTIPYTPTKVTNPTAVGVNSASVWLSPDETLLYIGNSQSAIVTAAFFNKNTGVLTPGCSSQPLKGFYNTWSYVGSLSTRDTTGTGGVLYVAEFSAPGGSIGIVQVNSNGITCSLTETPSSPVADGLSGGLLSIQVVPPRTF